jgi:glutathione S-transferase
MLTLFHSPQSRSTRVVALLKELDALDDVQIELVTIARANGAGHRDPRNPHPDGKVPLLLQDGLAVWESSAIFLHLADLFPRAGLNIPQGDARRGTYLSWLAWYAGVVEPVMTIEAAGLSHPSIQATFRGSAEIEARLTEGLADGPFLFGDRFTAADLLLHSPYAWFGKPGVPAIDAWVDRCTARPGARHAAAFDQAHVAVRAESPA